MAIDIAPPNSDDEVNRHRFYTAISAALDNNTHAMLSIGEKLDEIGSKHENVSIEFNHLKSSIATALRIGSIICVLLGGAATLTLQQTWAYADRLERLERTAEMYTIIFKPHETLPDQVNAVKQRLNTIEEDLGNLKRDSRKVVP